MAGRVSRIDTGRTTEGAAIYGTSGTVKDREQVEHPGRPLADHRPVRTRLLAYDVADRDQHSVRGLYRSHRRATRVPDAPSLLDALGKRDPQDCTLLCAVLRQRWQ